MDHLNLQRFGNFGIACVGGVATLNIQHLVYQPTDVTWNSITSHLLLILQCWDYHNIIDVTKGLGDRFEEMLDKYAECVTPTNHVLT